MEVDAEDVGGVRADSGPDPEVRQVPGRRRRVLLRRGFFFPKSTNGTSGAVRIGATLTDSTGTLSPVDMFVETALSAAGATRNQWNRLNCTLNIQDGYDTAQF